MALYIVQAVRQYLKNAERSLTNKEAVKQVKAVITAGGNLPAKFVIHTVGPVWNNGKKNEASLLTACYQNCLKLAVNHNLSSIAFPNISTGIYGYPKEEAAKIALNSVTEFLKQNNFISKVYLVCFDEENYQLYQSLMNQ